MSERFGGGMPPQEYTREGKSTEFSEQQEWVIKEFKDALMKYQEAEEKLKNYGVRLTPDKGFEPISFSEAIETDRQPEVQKEEERIKSEFPNFALKIEPHGSGSGDLAMSISNDAGKTFVHYATDNTAGLLHYLQELNKQTIDEFFESRNRADSLSSR